MNTTFLFQQYEKLVARTDQVFLKIERDFRPYVRCELHCDDCCHAVFGLFLIEALYLQRHFSQLPSRQRRSALLRAKSSEEQYEKLGKRLAGFGSDSQMASYCLGRERIRCPLLNERKECILYRHRPITCRVYGVPILIRGRAQVCARSGFKEGRTYPSLKLDRVNHELYLLSRKLLEISGQSDLDRAALLIVVSHAIQRPVDIPSFARASEAT